MAEVEQTEALIVEHSSGNVFVDLGLPNPDEMLVRAKLMAEISRVISERNLTQTAAAKLLGMDQPKVSELVRGKITRFSTERLIKALTDLGQDIELRIHTASAERGRFSVAAR